LFCHINIIFIIQKNLGYLALTKVSYEYDGFDVLANDPFFKANKFQAIKVLPEFISNEPKLTQIVGSFLQHISDIRLGKSSVSSFLVRPT